MSTETPVLILRVPREDAALAAALVAAGHRARLVRGAVVVELRAAPDGTYPIPPAAATGRLVIDAAECGGGMTKTGWAQVVCAPDGIPMRPYYVPRGGHRACGEHARFSATEIVVISASKGSTWISITHYRPEREGLVARLVETHIWEGEAPAIEWSCSTCEARADKVPGDRGVHQRVDDPETACSGRMEWERLAIPEALDWFQAAAIAARQKAGCYHCRCLHYACVGAS